MTLRIDPAEIGRIIEADLARQRQKPAPAPQAPQQVYAPAQIANPQEYIFLAGRTHGTYSYPDLLVSKQIYFKQKNWLEAHQALQAEQKQMLTLRQFVDFLHLLMFEKACDGAGNALQHAEQKQLLDEIIEVRNPWRSEWLDADFKVYNNELHINYAHELIGGQLKPRYSEKLSACLMESRTPGIDLSDWLKTATHQGLPPANVATGALYYYKPPEDNNSVAGFSAGAGWSFLYCNWSPRSTNTSLGVRKVAPLRGARQN